MKGKHFLDTNIFVYAFDEEAPDKRRKARDLIFDALSSRTGVISWQVVQEFINVATRKFATPLSHSDCTRFLENVLFPMWNVYPSQRLFRKALDIAHRVVLSPYDSFIVGAAIDSACSILYSEDLSHGQIVEGVTIVNPFLR